MLRSAEALGSAVKLRRRELRWSQAKLADQIRVQRQWVLRLEAGTHGAEIGKVLRALTALGLTITVGSDSVERSNKVAPASILDQVFAPYAKRIVATCYVARQATQQEDRKGAVKNSELIVWSRLRKVLQPIVRDRRARVPSPKNDRSSPSSIAAR